MMAGRRGEEAHAADDRAALFVAPRRNRAAACARTRWRRRTWRRAPASRRGRIAVRRSATRRRDASRIDQHLGMGGRVGQFAGAVAGAGDDLAVRTITAPTGTSPRAPAASASASATPMKSGRFSGFRVAQAQLYFLASLKRSCYLAAQRGKGHMDDDRKKPTAQSRRQTSRTTGAQRRRAKKRYAASPTGPTARRSRSQSARTASRGDRGPERDFKRDDRPRDGGERRSERPRLSRPAHGRARKPYEKRERSGPDRAPAALTVPMAATASEAGQRPALLPA